MNEREAALKVLIEYFSNKSSFDKALEKYSQQTENKSKFRAITNGTLKHKLFLDYCISKLVKINSKTDVNAINILRLAIYELLYTKSPDYAVINSYVEIIKKKNKRLAPFINAVLRNFSRKKEEIYNELNNKSPEEKISILYSHPLFLIKEWIKNYGMEETIKICEYNNAPPKITLRVNTLKISFNDFKELLQKQDIDFTKSIVKNVLILSKPTDVKEIEGYKEGFFSIQGESSCLVSFILNPQENQEILDLCAAPGGKTLHISELTNQKASITAVDVNEKRLETIKENAERLEIKNLKTIVSDASTFTPNKKYDRILIDAPCSNTGVLGKRSDARWNRDPEDIKTLSELQLKILKNASKLLKEDGIIVYSTCSIEKTENQEVIKNFLKEHKDFNLEDINPFIPFETKDKMIQILPSKHNMDGFFIAKLKKLKQ